LVLVGLVAAHIIALHEVGSNNPDGVEIKAKKDDQGIPLDGIPFHPYYSVHDIMGVGVFLMIFTAIIFFAPELGGYFLEANNFIPADPLKTPLHIAPVWYFTPYYSMLRAITGEMVNVLILIVLASGALTITKAQISGFLKIVVALFTLGLAVMMYSVDAKFWGVVVMGGAVVILFFLPWLDHCEVKSIRYKPDWHLYLYAIFVVVFFVLGYLGTQPPSHMGERISQVGTLFYFGFFMLMPWWSKMGEVKPVPDRVIFHAH
jgi:ubiquinol-cytochrome c reductase cytochrome b subunit